MKLAENCVKYSVFTVMLIAFLVTLRSEERRVGEEGRSRWVPYYLKKKKKKLEEGEGYLRMPNFYIVPDFSRLNSSSLQHRDYAPAKALPTELQAYVYTTQG